MSEIVDRVAFAIFRGCFHPDEDMRLISEKWDEWPESRERATNQARLAIDALLEPTEQMRASGQWAQFDTPSPPVTACVEANFRAATIWKAMIRSAMAEKAFA